MFLFDGKLNELYKRVRFWNLTVVHWEKQAASTDQGTKKCTGTTDALIEFDIRLLLSLL